MTCYSEEYLSDHMIDLDYSGSHSLRIFSHLLKERSSLVRSFFLHTFMVDIDVIYVTAYTRILLLMYG